MGKEIEEDFAYIHTIVTDMGNGSSTCGSCKTDLDIADLLRQEFKKMEEIKQDGSSAKEVRCPNKLCNKILRQGGIYNPVGGSDF